ncbi:N-alpha-acetyltransferase 20 isoform X2 [Lathamus discolor]|uniref:N-alpha-acetyltransferase 20 isoform X2 n=1 Tax=Lathamus discolor TaxID=678569 RepID=UPI0032B7DC06
MTTLRAFTCDDLFCFNNINLDPLTETYGIPFYLQYLAHWPEYFIVAEAPGGELMGYIMGKAEGSVAREEWHGHVTALSVAPEFRRLGLAAKLMELLEEISEKLSGEALAALSAGMVTLDVFLVTCCRHLVMLNRYLPAHRDWGHCALRYSSEHGNGGGMSQSRA